MKSTVVSKISAAVLLLAGLAFLFASDVLLPRLAPGIPASGTWLGELIGAGWLAMAAVNWLSRGAVLGGIYGRPVVAGNLAIYFISTMVLARVARENGQPLVFALAVPASVLALVYGWLLFRAPFKDAKGS